MRAALLRAIRAFFDARGYIEVDTPQMVPCPGLELHLRALPVGKDWLSTSPEYQMKRLVVGGMERIYQMGHAFRDEERGPLHVREFTLLEWYRVGASLSDLMEETEALMAQAAQAVLGTTRLLSPGGDGPREGSSPADGLDLAPPWHRVSIPEAFARYAGVTCTGEEDGVTLAARAREAGWPMPSDVTDWDEAFARLFVEAVEPRLGRDRPVFLHQWPARTAALARLDPENPTFAERFEVFAGGVELANAFCELTCPVEQRARLEADRAARQALGLPAPPVDEKFLAALAEGLPPTSGIALGVDRLTMLLTGARRIDDVLTFTTEEL